MAVVVMVVVVVMELVVMIAKIVMLVELTLMAVWGLLKAMITLSVCMQLILREGEGREDERPGERRQRKREGRGRGKREVARRLDRMGWRCLAK